MKNVTFSGIGIKSSCAHRFFLFLSTENKEYRMSALARFLSLAFLLFASCVISKNSTGPVVTLSYGSFQGNATSNLVEFLGMPFAAPPYAFLLYFSLLQY